MSDSGKGSAAPPTVSSKDFARSLVTPTQFVCLDEIFTHESHWTATAVNRASGAFGIGQEIGETSHDPRTQIKDAIGYISARYGDSCSAWAFWRRHGWY